MHNTNLYFDCLLSVVEGYLLTICAFALSIRLFLRSVAAGVSSSLTSTSAYNQGIQIIGGSGAPKLKRSRYSKFGDLEGIVGFEMNNFDVKISARNGKSQNGRSREENISESCGDAGNERFNVHKTVEIEVEYS